MFGGKPLYKHDPQYWGKISYLKVCEITKKVDDLIETEGIAGISVVPTKAAANALITGLTFPRIIVVEQDETQTNQRITYFFDGSTLQEDLLV